MSSPTGASPEVRRTRAVTGSVGAAVVGAVAYLAVSIGGGTSPDAGAVFGGIPTFAAADSSYEILESTAFVVGYDNARMNPLWASYRVFQIDEPYDFERPGRFNIDTRTTARVKHEDYTNTGYTRGHMAPNDAIMTRYGRAAQKETFRMSNVSPQWGPLNSGPWENLESIVKEYAQAFEETWVITGPIFDEAPRTLQRDFAHIDDPPPKPVQIPVAFYKILIDVCAGRSVRTLSFVLPQTASSTALRDLGLDLVDFLRPIDDIEAATGIDFLWQLPDAVEAALESATPQEMWPLDGVCP